MRIAVRHIDPNLKIGSESPPNDLADAIPPLRGAILKSLRESGSSELVAELLDQGVLKLHDFTTPHVNHRLANTAEVIRANYAHSIAMAERTFQEFSRKFLAQAKVLARSGTLTISSDEIDRRYKRISFQLVDPIKSGYQDPEFDDHEFAIRIPIPILTGEFKYSDFAHEAIHGLAGRNVVEFTVPNGARPSETGRLASRKGLRFNVPMPDGGNDLFEWLDEGLVEYLTSFFVPSLQRQREAYPHEVSIIKTLTNPKGCYRVPLEKLTAAYFADFDFRAEPGHRYPEWRDLNSVFPIQQINKINLLIETYGAERIAPLLAQRNVFKAPRAVLDKILES